MDAIKVTFTETVQTTSKVYLHEDRIAQLKARFGAGPYTQEQLTEYLEEDQVIYFDPDEAEIMSIVVPERDIIAAEVIAGEDTLSNV